MSKMFQPWTGVLSFILFLLLALPADALPKKAKAATKGTGATTGTGATANTNTAATAGGVAGAAAAGAITQATDGSTILDKTVQIK